LRPGGVHAQDVPDDELALRGLCPAHDLLGVGDGGRDRFFHEDVTPRVEGPERVRRVGVGICVDRNRVGPGLPQRAVEVLEARHGRELGGQVGARADAPAHQADQFEAIDRFVGLGMRQAHVADADDQYSNLACHAPPSAFATWAFPVAGRSSASDKTPKRLSRARDNTGTSPSGAATAITAMATPSARIRYRSNARSNSVKKVRIAVPKIGPAKVPQPPSTIMTSRLIITPKS